MEPCWLNANELAVMLMWCFISRRHEYEFQLEVERMEQDFQFIVCFAPVGKSPGQLLPFGL